MFVFSLASCSSSNTGTAGETDTFKYFIDQFADMRVLRYRLPDFEKLSFDDRLVIYYLSQAALAGRDIFWDQNFRYNLKIRKTLEAIIDSYDGERDTDEFREFITYAKRVFFANGIHHHYSSDKMIPGCSPDYFASLVRHSDPSVLPLEDSETTERLISFLAPVIFDPGLFPKKVDQSDGVDMVAKSASNFYYGVTQKEVEAFYTQKTDPADPHPVSTGLNSRVVGINGKIEEEVYRSGGKYGVAIDTIIHWLDLAMKASRNDTQKKELSLLIDYYRTGDLKKWDEFNVVWAGNNETMVDYNNGFIETYEDPLGMKATWEAIVNYRDIEASKRSALITENAQWFEDHSPIPDRYKKEKVTGVAAKVINVAMLGGDCYPASPLGINLPNADWIRKEIGSKSVTLANITNAYDVTARGNGFLDEFAADKDEIERADLYGSVADALHTDLHECIGHASGKLAPGTDPNALKNYASPLEEARADLVALYFMMDRKMTRLGLIPGEEAAKAQYDSYIRNGLLTQIIRIKPGKDIEQAHMRCRALVAGYAFDKGKAEKVIEMFRNNGKSYVKINDYKKLRSLFGELLSEIQRIKSEGDFEAGKSLVEKYGIKIDPVLHSEVLARYEKLNLAPYTGFINPLITPVYNQEGEITDIVMEYFDDYLSQMMYYGKHYSFLPASE